eukprot:gnl/TRDRNA2_/TRDRNA2_81235_c0_seq1.p1 gnl/TRDRNA2_/TRDRNA2_81235_c0~~gnl/TRDRNA2_/TRDRNA2_81235_c0_seq1.p1  ORF type:complete len:472 (-),score=58.92 gnl/TRDRNA2_/TRDRNA2_81235_c0_seq1:95-1510(-)
MGPGEPKAATSPSERPCSHGQLTRENMQHFFFRVCHRGDSGTSLSVPEDRPRAHGFDEPVPGQDGVGWMQLMAAIEGNSCRALTVGRESVPSELTAGQSSRLCSSLAKNNSLRSLSLGDVSSEAARLFAQAAFQSCTRLSEAKFLGPRADDALGKLVGMLLQPVWVKSSSLECLVIANQLRNLLTNEGAIPIARSLEGNSCLRTLVLFGTHLGDRGASAMASMLERNKTLEVLVFYGKALSGKGIGAFARWIKSGSVSLKELVLGGSEFTEADTRALARAVVYRRELEPSLSLSRFGLLNVVLGDACANALAELVWSGLSEVSILAGRLSDESVAVLARAPSAMTSAVSPRLHSLRLAANVAGNMGLSAFDGSWARGMPLQTLELALGGASQQACRDLMGKAAACSQVSPPFVEKDENGTQAPRSLYATNNVPEYLEDMLYPRLMLRKPPVLRESEAIVTARGKPDTVNAV